MEISTKRFCVVKILNFGNFEKNIFGKNSFSGFFFRIKFWKFRLNIFGKNSFSICLAKFQKKMFCVSKNWFSRHFLAKKVSKQYIPSDFSFGKCGIGIGGFLFSISGLFLFIIFLFWQSVESGCQGVIFSWGLRRFPRSFRLWSSNRGCRRWRHLLLVRLFRD